MLQVINLEFVGTLPGGVGQPFDRAIVMDTDMLVPHIITGKLQPTVVFRGDLSGAHAFITKVTTK